MPAPDWMSRDMFSAVVRTKGAAEAANYGTAVQERRKKTTCQPADANMDKYGAENKACLDFGPASMAHERS